MEEGFDFSGTREFDDRTGYRSQSFLTVPMKNHEDELIGVLQLINAFDPAIRQVTTFSMADQGLVESLASQAAIVLTKRQLIGQLENLFESFIRLISLSIDEKSPCTGGHCQRVPVLTMMLAEAVDATTDGPLADFHMDDHERYELKIAGLLHDCGKVTTPVHVVDKATKLQTIFDRIHLVDTRFEVLKRNAEIAALRQKLALRKKINASAEEIENLTIRAGTLTQKERETINYHIVATNKMLEQLPWPRHLRNVPEYAGGHHERMDGKGYPKGLTREQMSVQARVMGIADIFEALTARDRPYKQGMKLSQAMKILAGFKRTSHIDPDLFDIFVKQDVYRHYAEQFLDSAQIDAVNEAELLT